MTCPRCCPRKHLTCVARDGLASVGLVPVNAWGWVPGNRCRLLRIGIRHRADCREPVSISDDRACALMHPEANYQCRPPTNGTATGSEQRILSRKSDVAVACRYRVQCSGKQPSTSHQKSLERKQRRLIRYPSIVPRTIPPPFPIAETSILQCALFLRSHEPHVHRPGPAGTRRQSWSGCIWRYHRCT